MVETRTHGWRTRNRVISRTQHRTLGSRWLYRIDHYGSQPATAMAIGVLLACGIALGIAFGFSQAWVVSFEAGTSGVTLLMVFVIQHTQGREQAATQRKLDELLRALPEARTGLMMLEEASEETMRDVEEGQRHLHRTTPE